MKRMSLVCAGIMVVVGLVIGGWAKPDLSTAAPVKATVLKMALYAPPMHPMVVNVKETFPAVEKVTGGRVRVDVYDSEKLVTAKDTVDAVNRGMADMAVLPLPYFSVNIPWWNVSLIPGLIKDHRGAVFAARYGLTDMYQEAIHSLGLKIKLAGLGFPGFTMMLVKGKRVTVPEDCKGLKIGCPGKGDFVVAEALGGVPVGMTHPEHYEAMMRGLIDASIGVMASHAKYKVQEPADYLIMQAFGGPFIGLFISEESLGRLSESDQAAVIEVAKTNIIKEAFDNATGDSRLLSEITPQLKEVIYPTAEQSQKWKEALSPLLKNFLSKSGAQGQKAVDIIRKYN